MTTRTGGGSHHDAVIALPQPVHDIEVVEKHGFGYRGLFANRWLLRFGQIHRSRDDVSGLLDVSGDGGESIFYGRFNVASLTTRSSTAKYLAGRTADYSGWPTILERFCRAVLRLEEDGEPIEELDAGATLERRDPLIAPWLPELVATTIFGPGGGGKSTIAAAAAVAVTTGAPILSWAPRIGGVLVLDWEADRDAWHSRVAAVARGSDVDAPRLFYRRCNAPLYRDTERLSRVVADDGIRLLIVDSMTLALGSGGDRGDPNDVVVRLYEALRQIAVTTLIVDHVSGENVRNDRTGARPIGGVSKLNLVRSAWELRGEDAPVLPGQERQILLKHRKVNDGPRLPDQGIGVTWSLDFSSCVLRRCEVTAPDLEPHAGTTSDRMHRLLASGPLHASEVAHQLGVSQSTIRSDLRRHADRFYRLPDGRIGLAR